MKDTRILVGIDGSEYSENAALWGFDLAKAVDASVDAIYVVDPRVVDLFLSPEFAEELGLKQSIDSSAKIIKGLKKIGMTVLDLWEKEHQLRLGAEGNHCVEVGAVDEEIVKRSNDYDLTIVGHRGFINRLHLPGASHLRIGSVAERVAIGCAGPVLVAMGPPQSVECVLVAFDGSEPAKGALLLAEQLALALRKNLRVVTVVEDDSLVESGRTTLQTAASLLRSHEGVIEGENRKSCVGEQADSKATKVREAALAVHVGPISRTLLNVAEQQKSLIVLGAYGFKDPEQNVLGSTTTSVVRTTRSSMLIYRFRGAQLL